MTASNIVRFRVKPSHQEQFIAQHRGMNPGVKGFRGGSLVRTDEDMFCFIGEWASFEKTMTMIIDARMQHPNGDWINFGPAILAATQSSTAANVSVARCGSG